MPCISILQRMGICEMVCNGERFKSTLTNVSEQALIPMGYTKGIHFKSVPREPVSKIVHWNSW
jgi:hypothetical protein